MINVIGLGYIGLPTALMLSTHGNDVIGTDYNKDLISILKTGRTTFKEKGMDALFDEAVKVGINFSNDYKKTDIYIVTVPTPYDYHAPKLFEKEFRIIIGYINHISQNIWEKSR